MQNLSLMDVIVCIYMYVFYLLTVKQARYFANRKTYFLASSKMIGLRYLKKYIEM